MFECELFGKFYLLFLFFVLFSEVIIYIFYRVIVFDLEEFDLN